MIEPRVDGTRVILGPVRLGYVHLMEPWAPQGDNNPKYMATPLIPKDEAKTIKAIKQAIETAKQKGIVDKWSGKEPKKLGMPLKDGDEKDDEVFAGHYYLNAKSKSRPQVVDRNNAPIVDDEDVYSGMWALVAVNFWPYDMGANRGVGVSIENVKKVKDDERFGGGRRSAESDFGGIELDDDDDDL